MIKNNIVVLIAFVDIMNMFYEKYYKFSKKYNNHLIKDMETFIKQSSRLQKLGGDPDKTHLESPLHTIEDKRSQIV